MPLTAQQKAEILQKIGADPTKFWMDDNGQVIDLPQDNSAFAGVKSALYNAPRTVGGITGGGLGTAGAAALGLPSGPGAIAAGVAGAVAGGTIGGTLGEKLQEMVYPESWQLAQEAREVRNPGAVGVGELASQVAMMRPSPTVFRDAGRAVRALSTVPSFANLRPAQAAALGNVAIGGGLGAAQGIVQGDGVGDVLKSAALGALLHEPTRLGRAASLGIFKPHTPDILLRDAVDPASLRVPVEQVGPPKPDMSRNPALLKAFEAQQKQNNALAEELAKIKANDAALAKQREVEAALAKPVRVDIEDPAALEAVVNPEATIPRNVDSMEKRFLKSQAVEPDVEITLDPQKVEQPKPPTIAEPGTPGALNQELGIRTTQPFFDWWQSNAADNYHANMRQRQVQNEAGRDVAGRTEGVRNEQGVRDIDVAPNAYTDTAPHELTHSMILDVLQHGKKGEQAEMRRLLKAAGVDEESFVQGVGEDVVRRFMGDVDQTRKTAPGETNKKYKVDDSWRSDFVSFMKYKFGKATPEDARRIMSNTMLRGGGPKGVAKIQPKVVQQEEEKSPVIPEPAKPPLDVEAAAKNYKPAELPVEEVPANEEFNRSMQETRDRMRVEEMNKQNAAKVADVEAPVVEPYVRKVEPAAAPEVKPEPVINLSDVKIGSDVARPENRTYSGESIPANIRRGRANATNEQESAADLEARRIEADLAGEERPRYQEFGPNRPTSGLADTPSRTEFAPFESASQKLARSENPVIRTVGRALSELFPAQRAMQGKYRALHEAFVNLPEKDSDLLYRIFIDEYRDRRSYAAQVPARLKKEYNDVRRTLRMMREDQIKAGQLNVNDKEPEINPQYFPNVVDPSVRKTMVDEIDSPRYKQLRDEFIEFNKDHLVREGMTPQDADKTANEYFNRFIGTIDKQPIKGAFDFGAVTLPSGSRLPDNWLHSNPAEAMRQYVRDWSRSRTFHDIVQSNEDVMAGLGAEEFKSGGKSTPVTKRVTPVIKDDNVLYLLNEALGIRRRSADSITGGIGRATSALWLANPITRTVDIATSLFKGLGMVRPSEIPGLISNLKDFGASMERAHDTGWVKEDGNTIVGEVLGAGEAFTNGVDKFTKGLAKYTGSEKLENFGRGLAQNIGEYIARTNKALASSGNKRSLRFLDQVAPNWRSLSEAELGTRIGQLFQGRYDATNLPKWLSDSPAAPFFSLARWNIEQWNNFREFAIKPARNGDPVPLITMLLAGLVGGAGVKEIREALSGRKSKIATIKEIMEAPEGSAKYKEAVRYLGNLAQLSGTMGIVSEMGNWGLDIASKDMPAAATMPALELVKDVIPRLIAGGNAMMDGQDPLTVITQLGRDLGNEHVSAYRFIENNLGRTGTWERAGEDLKDQNARRDLRVGKRLRDEPIKAAVQMPIDYSRAEEREVEQTRDPVEMRAKARELKQDIRAEPDRETRERRMRSAAASRPSYMPSIDNDPKAFRMQLDFVRRTQGEDAAAKLRNRYLRDRKNAQTRRTMFN